MSSAPDPALWWLNYQFPDHRSGKVLSVVRVRDFWIVTTDHTIWKFSTDHDGNPLVQIVQEL